jgi:hypothetical protein
LERSEKHRDFILNWEETPHEKLQTGGGFSVQVSSAYPQLLRKLGGRPRRFVAQTRERAMAEARGFVDSLSLT